MADLSLKFHSATGKRQILVVEDEIINQQILGMILEETYDVLYAETGEQTLETVRANSESLSLILLDLNLPDIHGLELLKQLKDDPLSSHVPVIVMTAEKESEVESLTIGASDFIPKPYPQPKVVLARVNRTIELSEDRNIIQMTERDHLTGLYNREFFYSYAEQFDAVHKDLPTDALVFDINHFHMLNERYGREYGDEVLKQISELLVDAVREDNGIVCRREADTFLVYCPHRTDYAELLDHASITLTGNDHHDNKLRLRMGVYANVDKTIDIERRFDRAKLAADTVKNNLTKAIGIYDDSLRESEIFSEQLIDDFQTALEEKQFQVHYQPKFDIRGLDPVFNSAEALIRWKHPQLGMVSPGVFVPLFEHNGLIEELDLFVWNEAAAQIKEWKEKFGISVPVSVNVSRIDIYDPDFVETMKNIVEKNGLDYHELLLEITESAYTENSEQIIEKVNKLRSIGFRVEMDDFGSGYSSLNMISTLPIDALKLDMQFLRNAFRERKNTRLLEAVIQLAESLEVPTIAEGVETAEQMLSLKAMGCDYAQGYYFSRPLPADEFEKYVVNTKEQEQEIKKTGKAVGRDKFTYEALHDPLTGLYNHTAFEILFHDSDKDHIAVLITDIDGYQDFMTAKGKDAADQVVKRVASVLRKSFRSVDDICRLKDDEFVVIMTRMNSTMRDLVVEKLDEVNRTLQKAEEDSLPISLSVGVAFSDRERPEGDIFEDADKALLRMKEVKQSGCAIF